MNIMLSTLRRTGALQCSALKHYGKRMCAQNSNQKKERAPMSSAQATRMNSIIDLWDYELERNNAGAFGMQYIVSHPTTRLQSNHILKATTLIQQIMGFIAGGDGLSKAEIDLLCANQQLLCNYTFTSKVAQ